MTADVFLAVVVICGIYMVCEFLGKLTRYKVPVLVWFMVILLVFGGQLGIIPVDIFTTSGFEDLVYSFGLPFVLAGFGTSMSITSMKNESRTVIIAVLSVVVISVMGVAAGMTIMDQRTAIYGAIEVAGGGQAGLIFLTHLQELGGNTSLIALMLCLMNLQCMIGYPLSVVSMRKSMRMRIAANNIPEMPIATDEQQVQKTLIQIPEEVKNNFYYVFTMLGLICFLSAKLYALTSLSAYLWYILLGFLFAELGILERNCLQKAGVASILFNVMFVVVCSAFLELGFADIAEVAVQFVVLMAFGVIGCIISGVIAAKVFKIDFFEGLAISSGCMVGYPISQKAPEEALEAVRASENISEDVALRLSAYYGPKIVISGIVSISLMTGLLAGIVVSFL